MAQMLRHGANSSMHTLLPLVTPPLTAAAERTV